METASDPILRECLLQAIHVFCKLGLKVCSLILMDHIGFGKPVEHGNYLGILFSCSFLVGGLTKLLHRVPGGPGIIFIPDPPGFGLPDPLLC